MHALVSLILLSLASFHPQTRVLTSEWPRFRDDAHRVSFAYPRDLRPVDVPAESLHIDGLVKAVRVVSNDPRAAGEPILTVNVFICDDPKLDPRVPCREESSYRKWCDRFETFQVHVPGNVLSRTAGARRPPRRAADAGIEHLRRLSLLHQRVRTQKVAPVGRESQPTLAVAQLHGLDEPLIVEVVERIARNVQVVFDTTGNPFSPVSIASAGKPIAA